MGRPGGSHPPDPSDLSNPSGEPSGSPNPQSHQQKLGEIRAKARVDESNRSDELETSVAEDVAMEEVSAVSRETKVI